jgi:hypothetical protein
LLLQGGSISPIREQLGLDESPADQALLTDEGDLALPKEGSLIARKGAIT